MTSYLIDLGERVKTIYNICHIHLNQEIKMSTITPMVITLAMITIANITNYHYLFLTFVKSNYLKTQIDTNIRQLKLCYKKVNIIL